MLVVGFYTVDTPYEQQAFQMKESVERFGHEVKLYPYKSTGKWVTNCALKPYFIHDTLQKLKRAFWYLDADARVIQDPILFDNIDADIGVYYLEHKGRTPELISNTLYFNYKPQTLELVNRWCEIQEQEPEMWDQRTLQRTVTEFNQKLNIVRLPATYAAIDFVHVKNPVIQQLQVSRYLKKTITLTKESNKMPDIPTKIGNQRIRVWADGSFGISRHNKEAEAILDKDFIRCRNELRWIPDIGDMFNKIASLRDEFQNKHVTFVGKGPSLDFLNSSYFRPGPIVGINQAVRFVEVLPDIDKDLQPIFGIQQDSNLRDGCRPKQDSTRLLVSNYCKNFYPDIQLYIYQAEQYGQQKTSLTVLIAIAIAKHLGMKEMTMLCFDACVTKDCKYAKFIKDIPGVQGPTERFLKHRALIDKVIGNMKVNWVIPTDPQEALPDTQPQ